MQTKLTKNMKNELHQPDITKTEQINVYISNPGSLEVFIS